MKRIDAYLFFDENNCRDAFNFYHECLGGDLFFMTVGESPVADKMPPHMAGLVLHACLSIGDIKLMASDNCMGQPILQGKNVGLSLACNSEQEVHDVYAKLSAGGIATNAPKLEFWGDVFGTLTDKFGFEWMITYTPEKQ